MIKRVELLLLLFVALSAAVSAQSEQRIKFRKGAVSAKVVGTLTGFRDQKTFVIKVRAGQRLTVVANRSVTLTIADSQGDEISDMDASCNSRKIIDSTRAGDYLITAVECQKAEPWRGRFMLKIMVK